MSKKPVIKQKLSRPRSKRRFATWVNKIQKILLNRVHLVKCPKCKEKRLTHTVCQNCGEYRDRQVFRVRDPELQKNTTRVKA